MKKCGWLWFSAVFFCLLSVAVAGPFDTTVPKQSLHSTDGVESTTSQPVAPAAKQNSSSVANASVSNSTATTLKQMQQQFITMNQQFLLFQQRTDQRIENLTATNLVLQSRLKDMNQALRLLSADIQQLRAKGAVTQLPQQGHPGFLASLQARFSSKLVYFLIVALILFLAVLLFLFRPSKSKENIKKNVNEAIEEEYDFMGSPEGIAAKLDLARAYLAMQDYQLMREVLQTVLEQGSTEQKQHAQDLLDKIPESS